MFPILSSLHHENQSNSQVWMLKISIEFRFWAKNWFRSFTTQNKPKQLSINHKYPLKSLKIIIDHLNSTQSVKHIITPPKSLRVVKIQDNLFEISRIYKFIAGLHSFVTPSINHIIQRRSPLSPYWLEHIDHVLYE